MIFPVEATRALSDGRIEASKIIGRRDDQYSLVVLYTVNFVQEITIESAKLSRGYRAGIIFYSINLRAGLISE